MKIKKGTGILVHLSSLPNKFGIGTFGKKAFKFIDFLEKMDMKYWQILPLSPIDSNFSPYKSYSGFAMEPLFIDLEILIDQKLISEKDIPNFKNNPKLVEYEKIEKFKYEIYEKAFENFNKMADKDFKNFCKKEKYWLDNYALFVALKKKYSGKHWQNWDEEDKFKDIEKITEDEISLKKNIKFEKFLQFIAYKQFQNLKNYANSKNIKIIGDMPIFISDDSSDIWSNPQLFQLDENLKPIAVAGVPPDYFSETGQLWGNPLYDWNFLEKTNFQWWIKRFGKMFELYNILRVDHFRGFEAYWKIPFGAENGKNGNWIKAPGKKMFEKLQSNFTNLPVIAEDLGIITPAVEKLRDSFNFPGMKILQFAFDSDNSNPYLAHNYGENSVVYTGTHDNDTTEGWFDKLSNRKKDRVISFVGNYAENISLKLIKYALSSKANLVIIPIQDIFSLGTNARMNTPGTSKNNWVWRLDENYCQKKEICFVIKELNNEYDRV